MKSQYNFLLCYFFATSLVLIIKGIASSNTTSNFAAFLLIPLFAYELAVVLYEYLAGWLFIHFIRWKRINDMREILLGDCLEKLKEIPDNSVDSIVTDY